MSGGVSKQSNQIRVAMALRNLIMSRSRSDLSINIDACQLLRFRTVKRVKTRKKTAAKMLKQSDLRNFFGKRNAETDQEPSSSGCSESDQSKCSKKKKQPQKKIENSYRYKWLRCENDLMFCDTCLTAKACSNPFT